MVADSASADPYIDRLAEAADTPALNWADCGDGFLCATAVVPLNYNTPSDEQSPAVSHRRAARSRIWAAGSFGLAR